MSQFGIKGLAITPPLLGRISIGNMVERNGKRLPMKDDQITVTTQFQINRQWVKHPLDKELRLQAEAKATGKSVDELASTDLETMNAKLRVIPVKMLFNDPTLNLRAEYTCFNSKGRTLCRGNGVDATRMDPNDGSVAKVECKAAACAYGAENRCKPYTRLNVQIDGQKDELGSFMYRTVGWNSLRALQSKLSLLYGASNGKLAGLPLELVMRGKSSAQSMGSTFFYLDLEVRSGYSLPKAVKEARAFQQEWDDAGMSRDAFEEQARQGIANGMFEDSPDEIDGILEEFFPEVSDDAAVDDSSANSLRQLLDAENVSLGITDDSGQASAALAAKPKQLELAEAE